MFPSTEQHKYSGNQTFNITERKAYSFVMYCYNDTNTNTEHGGNHAKHLLLKFGSCLHISSSSSFNILLTSCFFCQRIGEFIAAWLPSSEVRVCRWAPTEHTCLKRGPLKQVMEQRKATGLTLPMGCTTGQRSSPESGKKSENISPGTAFEGRTRQQRWSMASREPQRKQEGPEITKEMWLLLRNDGKGKRIFLNTEFYAAQKPPQLLCWE